MSHPIGAEWKAVDSRGSIGSVWLATRHDESHEVWRWMFCYADGSGHRSDWMATKAEAVRECRGHFSETVRFKLI